MHVFNQPELYKTVKFTLDYLTSNSYFTSFSSPDHIIYDTRIPLFLRTVQGNRELGKMVASLELSGYPLAPAVTGESELKKLPNYLPAIQYLTLGSAERRADADSMIDMEFLAAAGSLWKPLQALTIRGFHAVHYHPLLQPGKSVHFVQLDHLHIALYHSLSRPPSRLKFWDIKRWFPHSTTDRREREQASFRKLSLILDHRGWNSMVFGANPSPYFPFNPRNLTHLHLGGSHSYDTVPSITLADFPSLQRLGKSVSCYSELNPSASWISTFLHLDASRSGGTSLISRTRSHLQVVVLDLPIDCMTFLPSSVHFFQDIDLQAWQLGVKIHIFHEPFLVLGKQTGWLCAGNILYRGDEDSLGCFGTIRR
ncbi:hypothetical protein DL96DRAFT_1684331 [Flagelloscypha sp. PMI_526]|nr:hypothetical protein DL96DRAFT_1684331 [Flagelloscypha sp. PMI_526]